MSMKVNNFEDFKLENLYLSELRSVVSLYKQRVNQNLSREHVNSVEQLTIDFGLPLAVLLEAKQVVAYAAAIVNPYHQVEIYCIFFDEIHRHEFQDALIAKAKNNFNQAFEDGEQQLLRLTSAIERLIYWLNL